MKSAKISRKLGGRVSVEVKLYEDENNELHAVKIIRPTQDSQRLFERECEMLINLFHPCVLPIHGYLHRDRFGNSVIMTEFMRNGNLRENIRYKHQYIRPRLRSPTKISMIVSSLALVMRYIHSFGVIHLDLQPSNILLDSKWRMVISDFSRSRMLSDRQVQGEQARSAHYSAPECFDDCVLGKEADVYSFGMILYELPVGRPVFRPDLGSLMVAKQSRLGVRPEIPKTVPSEVANLISRCWSVNGSDRPSFSEIVVILKEMKFKIHPKVKSDVVREFVDQIESWEKNRVSDSAFDPSVWRSIQISPQPVDTDESTFE
jgi:serine/threonine protein kinase